MGKNFKVQSKRGAAHNFFFAMPSSLRLDIPVEKQVELLATLKLQHASLVARGLVPSTVSMACRMVASAPSFYFCTNLFAATQAFASTRVIVKQQGNIVKSSVHVKRNVSGELMDAIVIKGPSYKLRSSSLCTDACTNTLTMHASTRLFHVYSSVMHTVHGSPVPPLLPTPPVADEVAQVKFDFDSAVSTSVPLFKALAVLPCTPPLPPTTPPPAAPTTPPPAAPTTPPLERASKRQRTSGAPSPRCYICFKHKTCDILFPCRVASHACCRKCIKMLYEMWSSDEFDGKATIKCPQCGRKDGLIERADGKEVWLGSRYMLRKKRRAVYVYDPPAF